jgi:3-isopropylmalate/(R)-2-methylmalate dehydratase large subunit
MLDSLKSRPIHRLPDQVRLDGRILFLTTDPSSFVGSLQARISRTPRSLRDDISTDEITPAYICYYYDETLGKFPYLDSRPVRTFPSLPGP